MIVDPAHPLLACHDCDQLQRLPALGRGELAACSRCGRVLARGSHDVAQRTLAYALAALVLLGLTAAVPLMTFEIAGRSQVAYLATGTVRLYEEGHRSLALMVLFSSVLAPLAYLIGLVAVSWPMALGWRRPWMHRVAKLVHRIRIWSMLEVFLLGVIVSGVKLADGADVEFGPASFALGALVLCFTAAIASYDPQAVWRYLDGEEPA